MSDDDPWELLDKQRQQGLSPEMARKLLEMNPAMRDRGVDTAQLVRQSNNAQTQKATAPVVAAKAAQKPAGGLLDEITRVRAAIAQEEKAVAEANKQLQAAKKKALEQITAFLLRSDPDLHNPLNQQILKDEARLLQMVDFDIKRYLEARKKR